MTVSEVKALEPLADVVELKPESRYLFLLPTCPPPNVINSLTNNPGLAGISGAVVCYAEGFKIYELGGQQCEKS